VPDAIRLMWPGKRSFWLAIECAVVGFGLAYLAALTSWAQDTWRGISPHSVELLLFAGVLVAVVGLRHPAGTDLGIRILQTHRELDGSRSPIGWAYAVAVGTAAVFAGANAATTKLLGDAAAAAGLGGLIGLGAVLIFTMSAWVVREKPLPAKGAVATPRHFFADQPITNAAEDVLARMPVAQSVAATIIEFPEASPGFISIEGEWGSGKSSVVALAKAILERDGHIAEVFSGFHFATTDKLVDALVGTIESALNRRYASLDLGREFGRYYEAISPTVEPMLPFGMPNLSGDSAAPQDRLHFWLRGAVKRPVVIFLEDLDRMRGEDLLKLLSAVQLVGSVRGFVFVLVLDPGRCKTQLSGLVPDPGEYLRKVIQVPIPLPPVPRYVLQRRFEAMLTEVEESRGVEIKVPPRIFLLAEQWNPLTPTLRHVKQVVNSFSLVMSLLPGEIGPFDALVASALNLYEPRLFDLIADNDFGWLTGVPASARSFQQRVILAQQNPAEARKALLATLAQEISDREAKAGSGDERVAAMSPFIDILFPPNRSSEEDQHGQHLAAWEYFHRFRERAIRPEFIPDKFVLAQIAFINAAAKDPLAAEASAAEIIRQAKDRRAFFDKLIVWASEFNPESWLPVLRATARISNELPEKLSGFEESEADRARALVYRLLDNGRPNRDWQREAMAETIRASARLEFARVLVVLAAPDRNRILSDFLAFDQAFLADTLADTVKDRLEEGYDPLRSELTPTEGIWVIAAIKDPKSAAEWLVKLGGVEELLGSARPHGMPGRDRPDILQWQELADFDYRVLQKAVRKKSTKTALDLLLLKGPGPEDKATLEAKAKAPRRRRTRLQRPVEKVAQQELASPADAQLEWAAIRHLCGDIYEWGLDKSQDVGPRLSGFLDMATLYDCPQHGFMSGEPMEVPEGAWSYNEPNNIWFRRGQPEDALDGDRALEQALSRSWVGTGRRPTRKALLRAEEIQLPTIAAEQKKGLVLDIRGVGIVPKISTMDNYAVVQDSGGRVLRVPQELFNWARDTVATLRVAGGNELVNLLPMSVEFGILDGRAYAEIL
jgi:hypothetical protein